jgi:F0F1-type ATP synthase delta subunit
MDKATNVTRGQHHLPQFLLKGFASRSRKKEVFTWLFRKDGGIAEANVKGIAKARDFYGNPSDSDIEQRLSEMEGEFAHLVRRLRVGEGLEDKYLLCQFVASTQVRTANLRTGVSEAMEMFTEEFGNALTAPENQARFAKHALDGVLKKIAEGELDHVLDLLPANQRDQVLASLLPKLKEQLGTFVEDTTKGMIGFMPSLTEPEAFKISQNKLLSTNLAPEPRVEHLMQLDWSVLVCEHKPLILGDVGVVAGSATGELMNILRHDPELDSIYLPISSNRLLLGQRSGVQIASTDELNAASAELSREFFISAEKGIHANLHSRIGARQALLPDDEVKDIVKSSFEGLNKPSEMNASD